MDFGLITTNQAGTQINFKIGNNPPKLTGLNKLVQLVLITMLTDPGTDKFDEYGGGLLSLLGSPADVTNSSELKSRVTVVISDTQNQIIAEQEDEEIPANERLKRIDLLDVNLTSELELEVDISIINDNDEKSFVRL